MSDAQSKAGPALSAIARAAPSAWALLPLPVWAWLVIKSLGLLLLLAHQKWLGLVCYFGPDPWLLYQIIVPGSSGFGPTFSHFQTSAKEVWLTIDDGPDPITTPAILDLLDQHQARATFFVIGAQVDAFPALAAEIVRRGHELGNHTQNHPPHRLWRSWPRATAAEIDACQAAIASATGLASTRFRAPVGIKNIFLHALLRRRDLDCIAWNARGFDCISKPDTAVKRIMNNIGAGAIVLVHEGKGDLGRVAVIERVLSELRAKGLRTMIPSRTTLRGTAAN